MNKEFVKPLGKIASTNVDDVDRDLRSIKKKTIKRKRSAQKIKEPPLIT